MRKFELNGMIYDCYDAAVTRNFWEYFFLEPKEIGDIRLALVDGFETEFGDVSMKEIAPFIISATDNLHEAMPPRGGRWLE